jgi:hypothetical protein
MLEIACLFCLSASVGAVLFRLVGVVDSPTCYQCFSRPDHVSRALSFERARRVPSKPIRVEPKSKPRPPSARLSQIGSGRSLAGEPRPRGERVNERKGSDGCGLVLPAFARFSSSKLSWVPARPPTQARPLLHLPPTLLCLPQNFFFFIIISHSPVSLDIVCCASIIYQVRASSHRF